MRSGKNTPNIASLDAIAELEAGECQRFDNVSLLMDDLHVDDLAGNEEARKSGKSKTIDE